MMEADGSDVVLLLGMPPKVFTDHYELFNIFARSAANKRRPSHTYAGW